MEVFGRVGDIGGRIGSDGEVVEDDVGDGEGG